MPTLKELYEGQSNWIFGTNYTSLKSDTETLVEQETSGIRIKSAVELNNPLIYGNEATRITLRSTPSLEKMKDSTGADSGDGGLVGQALGAITGGGFGRAVFGGRVSSLNQARDGINSKLGIPTSAIPSFVDGHGGLQKGLEPDTMITLGKIRKDAVGTEVGKFLKQTGGGNFQTIGRNLLGQGISLVKDKARDILLGKAQSIGENILGGGSSEESAFPYSSQQSYSTTIRNAKNNEVEIDKLQLPVKEKVDELKSKVSDILKKNKKIDDNSETTEFTDESNYSLKNETFVVNDSVETNLSIPSEESDNEKKQDSLNKQTFKLPLGETAEDNSTSDEGTYREKVKEEQISDRDDGVFSRIDLTSIPGNNAERKPKLFRTKGGPSDLGIQENNAYDDEVGYSSTLPQINKLETLGLTSNNGDLINAIGIPQDGVYKDGDTEFTKEEMEALDLVPFWVSGLDSSTPVFFRTLVTSLTETASPSWSSGNFVGNPYKYYTYEGVERNVSFTLNLYCMNETELMKNWERITYLTSKVYPKIKDNLMYPPFIKFRLGDIYNNKTGFIESLSYTMPDTGNWETEINGSLLPKYIDVQITIKFVEIPGSELALYSYTKSEPARQAIKEELNSDSEESVSGEPVTGGGSGEKPPVIIDNTGAVTDKAPEESNSSQGNSKGVTNINTGKKEQTPQIKNDEMLDGQQMVTFDSNVGTTYEERYKEIRKVVSEPTGAKKLAKRYGTPTKYLLDLKKEKDGYYYIKEEVQGSNGNIQREYAYYQVTHYGAYASGKISQWQYEKWNVYQKKQGKKSESDVFMSSDLLGGEY